MILVLIIALNAICANLGFGPMSGMSRNLSGLTWGIC